MTCPVCGSQVFPRRDSDKCPECGKQIREVQPKVRSGKDNQ